MTRTIVAALLAVGIAAASASTAHAVRPSGPDGAGSVVVAELFTSEGCSSCPPADAVLQELDAGRLVPGVQVVALSEHVDYWDHLGWRDPFSSAFFTERQEDYNARVFHSDSIYTPQLVVDGRAEMVGSDRRAVSAAIAAAARVPKIRLDVAAARSADGRTLSATISASGPDAATIRDASDVLLLVTERGLTSDVKAGENGGLRLTHTGVVRAVTTVATIAKGAGAVHATGAIPWGPRWNASHIAIVALLQERSSRGITGAGTAPLPASR
jgi:hypothetical protein